MASLDASPPSAMVATSTNSAVSSRSPAFTSNTPAQYPAQRPERKPNYRSGCRSRALSLCYLRGTSATSATQVSFSATTTLRAEC